MRLSTHHDRQFCQRDFCHAVGNFALCNSIDGYGIDVDILILPYLHPLQLPLIFLDSLVPVFAVFVLMLHELQDPYKYA